MRLKEPYIIIDPRAERRDYESYAARVPLSALQYGKTLELSVNLSSDFGVSRDNARKTIPCRVIAVYPKKQLLLVDYPVGDIRISETFKYVIDEGGG